MNGESDRVSATELRLVRELFPFCFLVGHDYQVVMTGDRLAQFDDRARVGVSFAELFEIERPTGIAGEADILTRLGEVFILKLRARPTLQLRGQFVQISANDDRSGLLFVGGPWINKITELAPLGLELADFPPHDPRGDLLVLLQTQESTLADLKLLTVRLRATGTALADRTREIERELQLRTELEAQLRQSQKMEAIGRLAGGIAHDFNNILMAVQGYVALSLSRVPPTDPVRAWIEEIRKAGDRAANLTRQLLAFSRQQVLRPQPLDLARELRDFEKLLTPMLGERIRLVVDSEEGLGFAWADASAMNQIIMNLALNARDAMPNGGALEIRMRIRHDVTVDSLQGSGFVEVAVRDTGIGMDEATKLRAFEPFFTTKEPGKGSGLGLAQVYGLVEQCGGMIELESELGKGSVFRVLLPRIEASAATISNASSETSAQGGRGERVLLVEDEPLVRKLLEQLFSRAGYQVSSSSEPAEALAIAVRERPFELIVTDVVMAGLTGPELISRIEAVCGEVPTIFMSGHTEDHFIRSGAMGAHQRFMPKPFSPTELLVKVRELLDARSDFLRAPV